MVMSSVPQKKNNDEAQLSTFVPAEVYGKWEQDTKRLDMLKKAVVRKLLVLFNGWTDQEKKIFYFEMETEKSLTDLVNRMVDQRLQDIGSDAASLYTKDKVKDILNKAERNKDKK